MRCRISDRRVRTPHKGGDLDRLLDRVGSILHRYPVDVYAVAKAIKCTVEVRDDLGPGEGCVYLDRREIFYKGSDHPNRQRSTIAHEIGHVLIDDSNDMSLGRLPEGNILEAYANEVGFRILMPGELFLRALMQKGMDLWRLAPLFGVSIEAASIRLSRLAPFPVQVACFDGKSKICRWVAQTASFSRNPAMYRRGMKLRPEQASQLFQTKEVSGVKELVMPYREPLHTAILHQRDQHLWVIAFVGRHAQDVHAYWESKMALLEQREMARWRQPSGTRF